MEIEYKYYEFESSILQQDIDLAEQKRSERGPVTTNCPVAIALSRHFNTPCRWGLTTGADDVFKVLNFGLNDDKHKIPDIVNNFDRVQPCTPCTLKMKALDKTGNFPFPQPSRLITEKEYRGY